jgi:hypothetical protein
MVEKRNAFEVLVRKPEVKTLLGRRALADDVIKLRVP